MNGDHSSEERSRFEQLNASSDPGKYLRCSVCSAIKELSRSMAEIRNVVKKLKRPGESPADVTADLSSKRPCHKPGTPILRSACQIYLKRKRGIQTSFACYIILKTTQKPGNWLLINPQKLQIKPYCHN